MSFRIHGRTFGEERSVCLADLQLLPDERFRYCCNFSVFWECDVRLEAILPRQGEFTHPRCVGGRHPAPDEDDGGAWGYQQLQDHYKFAPPFLADRRENVRSILILSGGEI